MSNNNTFGELLEQLLYISNQKKGSLAKELGYDISYISKWITGKNTPTPKNINTICNTAADFIVNSLNTISYNDIINYFGLNIDESNNEFLIKYISRELKKAYVSASSESIQKVPKDTQLEREYNGFSDINTQLRTQYLQREILYYANKNENLDIILTLELFNLTKDQIISFSDMKKRLNELVDKSNIKIRFLISLNDSSKNILISVMAIIKMISTYSDIEFEVYNCDTIERTNFFIIKDKILNASILDKSGKCMFSTLSKEKEVVDELYYNLDDMLKMKGRCIFERKQVIKMLEEGLYTQYILDKDLRLLIKSLNELFMPEDLFLEIGTELFGNNKEIMEELKKISIFLNNKTYKSKIKLLICEDALKKYISSGEIDFFNIPIKLNFKQRERHIEYLEKMLRDYEDIDIRLIEGNFSEGLNISLYLAKNIKFTNICDNEKISEYAVIKDNEFKVLCDKSFDIIWNDKESVIIDNKEEVIEHIREVISYAKIINEVLDDK